MSHNHNIWYGMSHIHHTAIVSYTSHILHGHFDNSGLCYETWSQLEGLLLGRHVKARSGQTRKSQLQFLSNTWKAK